MIGRQRRLQTVSPQLDPVFFFGEHLPRVDVNARDCVGRGEPLEPPSDFYGLVDQNTLIIFYYSFRLP